MTLPPIFWDPIAWGATIALFAIGYGMWGAAMKRRESWPPRCCVPGCQNTRLPMGPYCCEQHLAQAVKAK